MKKLLLTIGLMMGIILISTAQTNVSGTVTDTDTGEPIPGVNIKVEGTVKGTITDPSGNFSLVVNTAPPFNLVFSYVGYTTETISVAGEQSGLSVAMSESTNMGDVVVVSASRVEESVMESPVTIEKMDIIAIQQASAPNFYDQLNHTKGVNSTQASMTFNSVNTRGFATQANVRFVQLIDGVDNSAPTLNFPIGNTLGISELDVESVELVPGAASALYGPNAFNGILMMNSKSPFEYQGLSATAKVGINSSNAQGLAAGPTNESTAYGTQPYYSGAIRYAKSFANDRLAVKVNFSFMQSEDWRANDYGTNRLTGATFDNPNGAVFGDPNFDGLNLYGDETNLSPVFSSILGLSNPFAIDIAEAVQHPLLSGQLGALAPLLATLPDNQRVITDLRAPGYREEDLVDNFDASTLKADVALHWRITDQLELSYAYRFGTGDGVYQGGERYAFRDWIYQYHKLELKGNNFFVRAYVTGTDAGDTYNNSAMGAFINFNQNGGQNITNFGGTYIGTYAGTLGAIIAGGGTPTAEDITTAQRTAYAAASATMYQPGTPEFEQIREEVRSGKFKIDNPQGASFIDDSRLYHAEFNYNFRDLIDFMEIQVGGNFRRYDLFSNGTVFNEQNESGGFDRITIDEFGGYVQLMKRFVEERLKITASLRYDKNENFDGQVTPRISAVFSAGADRQHNIRASFQTGFRNPDTQSQFIFFPSSAGTLLGGTEANAGPYGIFNGGAISPTTGEVVNLDFVQPEQLVAFEVGYKGIINNTFLIDLNLYRNSYSNFLAGQQVLAAQGVTGLPTGDFPAGTPFFPSVNSDVDITSIGVGLGLTYNLPSNFVLSGTYNYAEFDADLTNNPDFVVGFNTPNNRFTLGFANREVVDNLGFAINYRWQEEFRWESTFADGIIPSYGVLDAQINYRIPDIKTVVKLGATNILQEEYRTLIGGPWIGSMYYISVTFDQFMRR